MADSGAQEHRVRVQRTSRVYSLGSLDASDVWVVLHGYGQLGARFIAHFRGIAGPERAVVAPEALNRFYLDPPAPGGAPAAERRVGTTWMTREDRDAEIADYVAYLDCVCSELTPRAERLTVLGFSQGVATACRWIALGATPVSRLIAWAGQLAPDVDLRTVAARVRQPVDIVIGDADEYAAARALDSELARLDEAGLAYRLTRFAGGHRMDGKTLLEVRGLRSEV